MYQNFDNEDLRTIFSSYHYQLIKTFKDINNSLLRKPKYIHAETSREIINLFHEITDFIGNVRVLKLIEEYDEILKKMLSFLQFSGGTTIPDEFSKINIIEATPIFLLQNTIIKENSKEILNLKPIGKGSYAQVYSFEDNFYNEKYILKRLNSSASKKDVERFLREFNTMKDLNSLFIAKVYKLNEDKREYIMEYLDFTLYEYIQNNNSTLKLKEKVYIIKQIILAFKYLAKKEILHRDISPNNVLLKFYDDILCVKIADFGLVKLEDSTLTDPNSECKGSLNDPKLKDIGFEKYDSSYEMYALTRLIAFILTGKSNFNKIKDENILAFLNKGISDKKEERYQNIYEFENNFQILRKKLKEDERRKG